MLFVITYNQFISFALKQAIAPGFWRLLGMVPCFSEVFSTSILQTSLKYNLSWLHFFRDIALGALLPAGALAARGSLSLELCLFLLRFLRFLIDISLAAKQENNFC